MSWSRKHKMDKQEAEEQRLKDRSNWRKERQNRTFYNNRKQR